MRALDRCGECTVRSRCLMAQLDPAVRNRATTIEVQAGETVFHEGSPVAGCYLVCRGRFTLTRRHKGHPFALSVVEPGAVLGEEALYGAQYACRAKALDSGEVRFIDGRLLQETIGRDPSLSLWLLERLSQRWKQLAASNVEAAYRTTEDRLRALLHGLAAEHDGRVELSQRELAQLLGVGRDTVNRSLQSMAAGGEIELGRRRIELLSHAELASARGESGLAAAN